jgi:rubrerythrin
MSGIGENLPRRWKEWKPGERKVPRLRRRNEEGGLIRKLECRKCGYTWYPRSPRLPKVCPACKTRKWRVG